MSQDIWADAIHTKVLRTIATIQIMIHTLCEFRARLLILTSTIIPSLNLPLNGLESSVVAALNAFTVSLRGELGIMGVDVCKLKLGYFDCSGVVGRHHL